MQNLSPGDQGPHVLFARERLVALGFGPLPQVPVFDDAMGDALGRFQAARLLECSGVVDDETWDALNGLDYGEEQSLAFSDTEEAPPWTLWPLWPGDSGSDVLMLQDGLTQLGYAVPQTGELDAATVDALRAFQRGHGLPDTGVLDEDVGLELLHLLSDPARVSPLLPPEPDDQPLAFGPELSWREVVGRGGYRYRQYEDGAILIVTAPGGRGQGLRVTSGAGWRAITAEIGPYTQETEERVATSVLLRGSRGDEVLWLQRRLNTLGFGHLEEDGIFGRGTAEMVLRFQRAVGLPADGVVDAATRNALEQDRDDIQAGSPRHQVVRCQQALSALGYDPGPIDGLYGPRTAAAVAAFQRWKSLPQSGVIDARTWGTLMATDSLALPPDLLAAERAALLAQAREATDDPSILGVLEEAIGWLGKKESPPPSNTGPDIDPIIHGWYSDATIKAEGGPPWCALACSYWLLHGLGLDDWDDLPFRRRFAGASQFEAWGRSQGLWAAADTEARPGAVFSVSRQHSGSDPSADPGAGHVGLVIRDLGSRVLTIEGNVGDKVKSYRRQKTSLRGYVLWFDA